MNEFFSRLKYCIKMLVAKEEPVSQVEPSDNKSTTKHRTIKPFHIICGEECTCVNVVNLEGLHKIKLALPGNFPLNDVGATELADFRELFRNCRRNNIALVQTSPGCLWGLPVEQGVPKTPTSIKSDAWTTVIKKSCELVSMYTDIGLCWASVVACIDDYPKENEFPTQLLMRYSAVIETEVMPTQSGTASIRDLFVFFQTQLDGINELKHDLASHRPEIFRMARSKGADMFVRIRGDAGSRFFVFEIVFSFNH